jgi:osmotically-inducible protein OsmY
MVCVGPTCLSAQESIPDDKITRRVEVVLTADEGVAAHLIDVATVEGVVTLSGTIDNAFGRERARTLTATVKGVRSIVNRIKVRAIVRANEDIRNDVVEALLIDPAADAYEVQVGVEDGVVTLRGTVQSWYEKRLAASLARRVKGVREVNNEIDVNRTSDRSDGDILQDVKSRLDMDPWIRDGGIEITVKDGRVTLSGAVGSLAEKDRAALLAHVRGVKRVKHEGLGVKWWLRDEIRREEKYCFRPDPKIEDAVEDALLQDPRVRSFHVGVDVDRGRVTLTGKVDNLEARRAAGDTARNTLGVWQVMNHLRVRPVTMTSDEALRRAVVRALERDPYLERREITVRVRNAKVFVGGIVDSHFLKNHTEDVVSAVNGVVDVRNSLFVNADRYPYGYDHYPYQHAYPFDYTYYPRHPYGSPVMTDEEIQKNIRDEFWWNPRVGRGSVNVTVEDGVATLTGIVDTWQQVRYVIENAYEGGARSVRNRLEVRIGRTES